MASRRQYTLELLLGAKTEPGYNASLKNAEKALTGISSTAKRVAGLVTSAFAAINISNAIESAVEEYSGFEKELTNTSAIAGASQAEYEQMEQAARDAGKATTKTASESAAALGYMALAGWDVDESTSALMPVLKLSEATNLDLARTSDLVTDSMGALKIEVSELPGYLDLVTKAQNSSNQTAEQMMEGYIRAGGAARSLGIDAKDTGIALGILANNGTKAGEGGRALNAMLTRIAANKEAVGQIEALGTSIFDADGNFVGFEETLKRLNAGLDGLTMQEQAKALKNIAGTQYYTRMKYLLDGVKEGTNGAESAWDNLERKLSHAEGTLDEMDEKITGTMSGQMQIMNSALSDAKISFGDAFKTEIVEVIQDFTGMFNDISEGITSFADENEIKIHQTFEAVKENVINAGEFIGNFTGGVIDNFDKIESIAAGLFSVSLTSKAIKQFKGIKGVVTGFIDGLGQGSFNKFGLIAGGLSLAAGAVTAIGVHIQNTHKKLVQADLEGHFEDISLSLEDIDEISQQIVGKKKLVRISEMLESVGKTDEAIEKMAGSMKDISRTSWKVRAGFKLDIDDRENYKSDIESYVKSAQDVIDNQGYTVSVATDILFGKNSKISKKNDAFYSGLDAELATLEKKLNKKIGKAVEDGVDIPTDKAIQKLLGKINTITTAITDAEEEANWQQLDLKYSGKDLNAETFKELSDDIEKYTDEANKGADEAYNTELTNINAQKNIKLSKLKEKRANKKISKKEYNKRVTRIENKHESEVENASQAYYDTKSKTLLKGSKYLVNSITEAYPEAKQAIKELKTNLESDLTEALSGNGVQNGAMGRLLNDIVKDSLDNVEMPAESKEALSEIIESGLSGIQSDMSEFAKELENSGLETTKAFGKGMNDVEALAAVTGSRDDALSFLGNLIGEDSAWSTIISACEENGANIPEQIGEGINRNQNVVTGAVTSLLNTIENSLGSPIDVQVSLSMANAAIAKTNGSVENNAPKLPQSWTGTGIRNSRTTTSKSNKRSNGKLVKNARGGIYSSPVAAILAEDGDSEAVIPLNSTSRAKALWHNAGKMLGMDPVEDKTLYNTPAASRGRQVYNEIKATMQGSSSLSGNIRSGDNIYITCSPQITINGNADKEVITQAFSVSQAEIMKAIEKYFGGKKRTSFKGRAAY